MMLLQQTKKYLPDWLCKLLFLQHQQTGLFDLNEKLKYTKKKIRWCFMDENEPKGATIHDMWITNYANCQSFLLLRLRQWRGMMMMTTTTATTSQVLMLIINLIEKSTCRLLSIHESASRKWNNSYLAMWKMRQF